MIARDCNRFPDRILSRIACKPEVEVCVAAVYVLRYVQVKEEVRRIPSYAQTWEEGREACLSLFGYLIPLISESYRRCPTTLLRPEMTRSRVLLYALLSSYQPSLPAMAFQSPLISIPKKTTTDVDWTNPIRSIIAQSFGEDPKNYTEECAVLQRCRQDAVRGAGSDNTGTYSSSYDDI